VAASAAAQTPVIRCADPEYTLTISGTGMAKAVPDRVSFSVGVSTTAKNVAEAFRANAVKTRAVIDALKKAGVKDREIQTTNFSITQSYLEEGRRGPFVVTNRVTVIREDPAAVSDLLQAAIDAGANDAGALTFFVADPSQARDKALEAAFGDARGRAEKLAAAAKRTLGAAMLITATPQFDGGALQNTVREAITVSSGPDIESGVSQITETVTVTFELK
ncbi:MAG TPA: SIMPL domain-containing protein, partial [Thermoanaerobaculia bacterium]|nr:SIMPL domain-containing protein [Thermoanaerobaculia bacterium]